MSVIVTDEGFGTDDWSGDIVAMGELSVNDESPALAVDVPSDAADLSELRLHLQGLRLIRVEFPSSADGRGFSIASELRRMGYEGRLRAHGHVLADQYSMARRVGFDEVEISDELAQRQPESQWMRRADWRAHDYQSRLRG